MKVPLAVVLVDHSGLLQQVVDDVSPNGRTLSTGQRPWIKGRAGRERGEAGVLRSHVGSSQHAGSIGEKVVVYPQNEHNNKQQRDNLIFVINGRFTLLLDYELYDRKRAFRLLKLFKINVSKAETPQRSTSFFFFYKVFP